MRRDQLEHAIRTACQIIGRPEVIVVGSQAILGTFGEDELPRLNRGWHTRSMVADPKIGPLLGRRQQPAARSAAGPSLGWG
jgi:hypothetical protein